MVVKQLTIQRPKHAIHEVLLDALRPGARGFQSASDFEIDSPVRLRLPDAEPTRCIASVPGFALWPIIAAVLLVMILLVSFQPVTRLRPEPPASFVRVGLQNVIDQQTWANAYWDCAKRMQGNYPRNVALPQDPTPEFHVTLELTVSKQRAEEVRLAYWRQLQKSWLNAAAWNTTYAPESKWLASALEIVQGAKNGIVGTSR